MPLPTPPNPSQRQPQVKKNVQGEYVKKLDVLSNGVLKNALRFTGKVRNTL